MTPGTPEASPAQLHRWALTNEEGEGLDRWLGSRPTAATADVVNTPLGPGQRTLLHTLAARRPPQAGAVAEAIRLGGDVGARDVHSAQPLHLALGWSRELREQAFPFLLDVDLSGDPNQAFCCVGDNERGLHGAEAWAGEAAADGQRVAGRLDDEAWTQEDIKRAFQSAVDALHGARAFLRDGAHGGSVRALLRAGADPLASLAERPLGERDAQLPPAPRRGRGASAHRVDALTLATLGGHYGVFRSVYRALSTASCAPDSLCRALRRALRVSVVAESVGDGDAQQRRISLRLAGGLWNLALRGKDPRQDITHLMNLTLLPWCGHISQLITTQVARAGAEQAKSWVNHEHRGWSSMLAVGLMRGVGEGTVRAMLQLGACPVAPVGPSPWVKVPPLFWAAHLYDSASMQLLTMILVDLNLLGRHRGAGPGGRRFPSDSFVAAVARVRRRRFLADIAVVRALVECGAQPTDTVAAWSPTGDSLVCTTRELAPPSLAPRASQNVFSLGLLDIAVACDDLGLASYLREAGAPRAYEAMRARALATFRPSDAMRQVLRP